MNMNAKQQKSKTKPRKKSQGKIPPKTVYALQRSVHNSGAEDSDEYSGEDSDNGQYPPENSNSNTLSLEEQLERERENSRQWKEKCERNQETVQGLLGEGRS